MKNMNKFGLMAVIIVILLISGCEKETVVKQSRIETLPLTAEILFVSNRDTKTRQAEIYAMDAQGGNITRLTFSDYHHFILGIDNSHRYIVATRIEEDTDKPKGLGDEDKKSLWLLDLVDQVETRLSAPDKDAGHGSFSPDGEWIVFRMRSKVQDRSDIYKIRLDETGLTNLTNYDKAKEYKNAGDPSWSHDGSRITFNYLDTDTPRYVLKTMDENGNDMRLVYDGGVGVWVPEVFPPGNYDPSWSPDDQWLVFERAVKCTSEKKGCKENFGSGFWHIFKVRKDGSSFTDLSLAGDHADRAEYLPSYSSDGKFIIFGSIYQAEDLKQSHNDIFIMDTEGGSLKQLTNNPANDMYPIWIP